MSSMARRWQTSVPQATSQLHPHNCPPQWIRTPLILNQSVRIDLKVFLNVLRATHVPVCIFKFVIQKMRLVTQSPSWKDIM